jgi:hypothetical protein
MHRVRTAERVPRSRSASHQQPTIRRVGTVDEGLAEVDAKFVSPPASVSTVVLVDGENLSEHMERRTPELQAQHQHTGQVKFDLRSNGVDSALGHDNMHDAHISNSDLETSPYTQRLVLPTHQPSLSKLSSLDQYRQSSGTNPRIHPDLLPIISSPNTPTPASNHPAADAHILHSLYRHFWLLRFIPHFFSKIEHGWSRGPPILHGRRWTRLEYFVDGIRTMSIWWECNALG